MFSKSSGDYGTLAFFRVRLNRSAVSKEPKKDVNATIDFLEAVIIGHWIACACEILNISNPDEEVTLPGGLKKAPISEQLCFVEEIAKKIVDRLTIVLSAYLDITENSNDNIINYTRSFAPPPPLFGSCLHPCYPLPLLYKP